MKIVLYLVMCCALAPLGASASTWHPFTRAADDGPDLIEAITVSSRITMSEFRARINRERSAHGEDLFVNDSSLAKYLRNDTYVVPCKVIYPNGKEFTLERVNDKREFDSHQRPCEKDENILVDSKTQRPIASLACGNVIQETPVPVVVIPSPDIQPQHLCSLRQQFVVTGTRSSVGSGPWFGPSLGRISGGGFFLGGSRGSSKEQVYQTTTCN